MEKTPKFLFLDECISQDHKFVVVSGFIFTASKLYLLEEKVAALVKENELNNLEDVRKIKMPREKREEINKKIASILKEIGAKLISSIILSKEQRIDHEKYNIILSPFLEGIHFIIERINFELKENEYAIIFYDKDTSKEYLSKALDFFGSIILEKEQYLSSVVRREDTSKKIYALSFIDNRNSLAIQLADLICGAITKAANNYFKEKKEGSLKEDCNLLNGYFYGLDAYWPLFCKNFKEEVKGYGIKVW